jgi:hypothetical protein
VTEAAESARRWLQGGHRTWRWNDGSYASKNRYDAVETTEDGLLWFGFDGTRQGVSYRAVQPFADFLAGGALKHAPAGVLHEVRMWIEARQCK